MGLAADILWPLAAVAIAYRCAAAAERFAPATPLASAAAPDVPQDLVALAMTESESWAQEETLKAMRERYELAKDWNMVRAAFGVGRIDGDRA